MAEPTLLILGGTSLAMGVARAVAGPGKRAIYSLAGRTEPKSVPDMEVRTGGFGGAEALADYLRRENITAVIDATHAYAAGISANARAACAAATIPLLRLQEPPWQAQPGDRWIDVADMTDARDKAAEIGTRVFVSTGRQAMADFADDVRCWWLARVIAPGADLPELSRGDYVYDRGPFDMAGELALLQDHEITAVISKNSGSAATYAKIAAARELGLPVIMIARPVSDDAVQAETVAETVAGAVSWLNQ
jgi:precorrin-6A/cobalt-precorrin-6A reductase